MENIEDILAPETTPEATPETTPEVTPEVTVEATPEVKAETKPIEVEKAPEKPPEKYVPHGALHEERMRRKELADELRKTQEKMSQFESLREELAEIRRQKQAEQAKKFEDDPVGAIKEQQDKIVTEISQFKQQQEQNEKLTKEQAAMQARERELFNTTQTMAREYAQENQDYPQALDFVMSQWTKQAQVMGFKSQQELDHVLTRQALALADHAIARGQNPAAVVHELAKSWGFKFEAPKPTAEQTLDKLEKGQQAAKSNGATTGQSKSGDISLKDIEDMSDAAFDKLWADMEKSARRR